MCQPAIVVSSKVVRERTATKEIFCLKFNETYGRPIRRVCPSYRRCTVNRKLGIEGNNNKQQQRQIWSLSRDVVKGGGSLSTLAQIRYQGVWPHL